MLSFDGIYKKRKKERKKEIVRIGSKSVDSVFD